jgi:predicted dehydrogenase
MINMGIVSYAHVHVLRYAPAIASHPKIKLVGIAGIGPNKALAKKDAERYGCSYHESLEEFFKEDLQAIYIATEPSKHKEVVKEAAKRKIHILCDKPIATNLKDADEIIRISRENKIKLMIPFNPRFQPPVQKAKEMLDNGEIGEVQAINAIKFGKNPCNFKDFDVSWFFNSRRSGGGGFGDIGIHAIDAIRWLAGSEVYKVYADIRIEGGVDLMGTAIIEFENGVIATLTSGWTAPFGRAGWVWVKFEILGTKGAVVIERPLYEPVSDFKIFTDERALAQDLGRRDVQANLDEFLKSILEDREPAISGEDGRAALEIVLAAYKSAQTGKEIKLPLK